ncbi:MAG: ABC transporter ATP-binding protein [Proteobacteria bacterium]|nr:ABC transporter ATP-binding protein [Pseudomonadota bacterium]
MSSLTEESAYSGTSGRRPAVAEETRADVEFAGVTKRFGEVLAVDNVSLAVERGAFTTLLGPSGCGKTTSLRLVAGFEQPSAGEIKIGGQSVVGVPAYQRPVNMVFQHYALFPHLSVAENIGYGLRQRRPRPSKREIAAQVGEMMDLVRLPGFEARRAWELSGGQQQRVALARALINRPTVLLLDEPLAALDRKLRREMQIELQTLQREVGITFVLVTHDQEEALSMSDTICIMRDGRIVQTGSPRALYDEPINHYVADFIGKSNFFIGEVLEVDENGAAIKADADRVLRGRNPKDAERLAVGERGTIAVRPELVQVLALGGGADAGLDVSIEGRVKNRIFLGEHTEYLVATRGFGDMLALVPKHVEISRGGFNPGDEVSIGWYDAAALSLKDA